MPATQRTDDRRAGTHPAGIGKLGTRLLELAENVIYAGIATFLVRTALVCLALAGLDLPRQRRGVRRDVVAPPAQGARTRRAGELAAGHPSVRSTDPASDQVS